MPLKRRPAPRPTCTHIVMSKCYGPYEECHQCRNISNIGFVYLCEQDNLDYTVPLALETHETPQSEAPNTLTELEHLSFSRSVIKAANEGFYTPVQLETLISQRKKVRDVIEAAMEKEKSGDLADVDEDIDKPSDDTTRRRSRPKHDFKNNNKRCQYKICHRCRALARDRCFVSFEAVFEGSVRVPDQWEKPFMPVIDLFTVQDLGQRAMSIADTQETLVESPKTASSSAVSFTSNGDSNLALSDIPEEDSDNEYDTHDEYDTQDDTEGNSSTPRSMDSGKTIDTAGFRDSLRKSLQDMIQRSSQRSSSNRFQCKDKRRGMLKGKSSVDVELWREMTENILQDAASKELPPSDEEDALEPEKKDKVNEEVHVPNGVALTEEAVENNAADLITSV